MSDPDRPATEDAAAAAEVEGPEVDAPLVLQCKKCKAVVGDTFAFVCAKETLNTITLHCATSSVNVGDNFETSKQKADRGSTFSIVSCVCGAKLGRVYVTTTTEHDDLREMITFDITAITSYKLGSATVTVRTSDEALEGLLELPTAISVQRDILKLKNLVLVFNDRIEELEKAASGSKRRENEEFGNDTSSRRADKRARQK